jgi:hypothetical protein
LDFGKCIALVGDLHRGSSGGPWGVTNDKGTREALGEAGAGVERQLAAHGTPHTVRLVMTCDEFTALVEAPASIA